VPQKLADNFCEAYGVNHAFMQNLKGALDDRPKCKVGVLLVDLDNVPKFWQQQSVDEIATMPFPVFVFGSANATGAAWCTRLTSRDNFHFTLALQSKDAADAVLNMMAASLHCLIVAHDRVGDVGVIPISDDKIFLQTAEILRKGGSPSEIMSRKDAASGFFPRLLMAPLSQPQLAAQSSSDKSDEWKCSECWKTFATEKAFKQHQRATGHTESGPTVFTVFLKLRDT